MRAAQIQQNSQQLHRESPGGRLEALRSTLLEVMRPLSFFAAMLSLYPVMMNAFFVPGTGGEERLALALLHILFAGCICFASGLLYCWPDGGTEPEASASLLVALPVRMFFWALTGMGFLFALSWYIEAYYIPLTHHGCCRP